LRAGIRHKAVILAEIGHVRAVFAILILAAAPAVAAAQQVPLPRPRPTQAATALPKQVPKPEEIAPLSACRLRLMTLAVATSLPPLVGTGECGIDDVVQLEAVLLPDKTRVAVTPPATLRCSFAEAIVHWVREDVAPTVRALGAPLKSLDNYASYDCRGRNRVIGAKMSEHGKGNALDMRSFRLADGKLVGLTDPLVAKDLREQLRKAACGRFATVLGPGSDGYHENHVHVDLAERRSGHRMCQWDVREPAEPPAAGAVQVPLPRPRPSARVQG
jgi:hypothetical protein